MSIEGARGFYYSLMMSTGSQFDVDSTGHFSLGLTVNEGLDDGEVGFVTAAMKSIGDAQVGDNP